MEISDDTLEQRIAWLESEVLPPVLPEHVAYDDLRDLSIAKELQKARAKLAEAEKLLRGALVEIEATGAAEGYYFGPDPQIDEKIIRFLANE